MTLFQAKEEENAKPKNATSQKHHNHYFKALKKLQ